MIASRGLRQVTWVDTLMATCPSTGQAKLIRLSNNVHAITHKIAKPFSHFDYYNFNDYHLQIPISELTRVQQVCGWRVYWKLYTGRSIYQYTFIYFHPLLQHLLWKTGIPIRVYTVMNIYQHKQLSILEPISDIVTSIFPTIRMPLYTRCVQEFS